MTLNFRKDKVALNSTYSGTSLNFGKIAPYHAYQIISPTQFWIISPYSCN